MSSRPYIVNRTASTEPVGQQLGDEWFNTTTNRLLKQVAVNGSAVTSAQVLLNINNQVLTTGNVTAVGNIQSDYFIGNGRLLTGIASSGGGGSFQVGTRTGSRTVTISAGSFGVGTRNSGTRQVAVT
jgi:hypothetical protein